MSEKQDNNLSDRGGVASGSIKEALAGLFLIIIATIFFFLDDYNTNVVFSLGLIEALGFSLCAKYLGGYISGKIGYEKASGEAFGLILVPLIFIMFFWFIIQNPSYNDSFTSLNAFVKINGVHIASNKNNETDPDFKFTKKTLIASGGQPSQINSGLVSGNYNAYVGTKSSELNVDLNINTKPAFEKFLINLNLKTKNQPTIPLPYYFTADELFSAKNKELVPMEISSNEMAAGNLKMYIGSETNRLCVDINCEIKPKVSTHTLQPFTATFSILLVDSYRRREMTNQIFGIMKNDNYGSILPICPLTKNFLTICKQICQLNPKVILIHYHCFRSDDNEQNLQSNDLDQVENLVIRGIKEIATGEHNRTRFVIYSRSFSNAAQGKEMVLERAKNIWQADRDMIASKTFCLPLPWDRQNEEVDQIPFQENITSVFREINQSIMESTKN